MEAPQRRPLADDWHGGDSTDVLDAEDEAAYIAGTRTRLEGVPRRPDSPSSLDAIAEAEEPPAAAKAKQQAQTLPTPGHPAGAPLMQQLMHPLPAEQGDWRPKQMAVPGQLGA